MAEQKSDKVEPSLRQLISFFPLKCKMYLSLLISLHDSQVVSIPKNIKKAYESFTSIFKKLASDEQYEMIKQGVKYLSKRLKGETMQTCNFVEEIEASCEVKSSLLGVSYWDKKAFKFDFGHRSIKLSTPKKSQIIQVKHYLVRKSKSQKNAFVMESIESNISDAKAKVIIRFKNKQIFEEIYKNIRNLLIYIGNRRLEKLLREQVSEMLQTEADQIISKGLTFLTPKAINEYFDEKVGELKKIVAHSARTIEVFNQHGISLRNSSDNGKYYFLSYTLPIDIQTVQKARQLIPILSTRSQEHSLHIERLQTFNQSLTAHYLKASAPNLQWQSVMIVESIDREQKIQKIMMATSNIFHGVNIHFLRVQLHRNSGFTFVVNMEIVLKSSSKHKQNVRELAKLLTFFVRVGRGGELSNINLNEQKGLNETPPMTRKKSLSSSINRKEYFESQPPSINLDSTDKGKSSENDDEVFYSIEDGENQEQVQNALSQLSVKNIINFNLYEQKLEVKQKFNSNAYLKRHYQLNIKIQDSRIYNHSYFPKDDWQKLPKGGVVCINQKVITQQKNVFKLICKQFGSKLFKMESGMNLSLPVQICRPESALISIARNLTYAPLLLTNHNKLSPLNRFQNVAILQISMGLLALSTQKPFNPILGETYQAWVDGCPLYMQQISHHPPITYIYFTGRGYKIYGPVAPQIGIRLNYCKGINQSYLTVQFDNGQKIDFNLPTMIINGMLFGQRSIYFDSTNYVIDFQNRLIAEVIFNAGKGFFGSKQSPDYLTVQIYQVTQGFLDQFLSSKRNISPKKAHGSKLCSSFSGEWNGSLLRGSETIFDFLTVMPVLMTQEQLPLPSDSTYRVDVAQLLKNDMEKAQAAKQKFQQIQRRDKKLRVEYSKKKK